MYVVHNQKERDTFLLLHAFARRERTFDLALARSHTGLCLKLQSRSRHEASFSPPRNLGGDVFFRWGASQGVTLTRLETSITLSLSLDIYPDPARFYKVPELFELLDRPALCMRARYVRTRVRARNSQKSAALPIGDVTVSGFRRWWHSLRV